MTSVWIDTNVIIRLITKDSSEQTRQVQRLVRRAETGDIVLRVPTVVIAEAVWVLGSAYSFDRAQIAEALRSFVLADGVDVEEREIVVNALRLMQDQNVAYVDAYLAALARRRDEPVASFDAGFRRLGVELIALSA